MSQKEQTTQQMEPDELKQEFLPIQFIHWALLAAVFIYAGLAGYLVQIMDGPPMMDQIILIFAILTGVSIAQLIGIALIRKFLLAPSALMEDSDDVSTALANYKTGVIVQGALSESIAIYGLLLTILSGSFYYFAGFGVVAVVLLLLLAPSQRDFETRMEKRGMR